MDNNVSTKGRWTVAICGIIMMVLLGTVYGWSVFKKPVVDNLLVKNCGLSEIKIKNELDQVKKHESELKQDQIQEIKQVREQKLKLEQDLKQAQEKKRELGLEPKVGMAFTIAIFCIGLSAALGGKFVDKTGARKIASLAAILFGIGTLLTGLADSIGNIWLLYLGYGLIAGVGNGLGYITPIAVLVRWFPDKRGLITGLCVMGFGFGAAILGQVAPLVIPSIGVSGTFYLFGAIYLVVLLVVAQKINNPPSDWVAPASTKKAPIAVKDSVELKGAVKMYQFYLLWLILFINVTAGIALISNLSPMAQSQVGLSAIAAGTLIFISSLFNGLGRIFWASLSDKIGRRTAFLLILGTQVPLFIILPSITSVALFGILCCYILACYGGGFATMPSFAADTFGPKNMGSIYGKVLLAWGFAGVLGPIMMERIKISTDSFAMALYIAAGMLAVGFILALLYRRPVQN